MKNNYKRVICIGGHPLDAEIMGGPMIIKMNKHGAKSTLVHVTTGRLEKKDATEVEKQEYLDLLNVQIKHAADVLGADVYAMNHRSSSMPSMEEFVSHVADYLRNEKADLVITHHLGTLHDRHYYTYRGVYEAVKKLRKEGRDIDLLYGENLEDLVGFVPTGYLYLDEHDVDTWFACLNQYDLYQGAVNVVPYDAYYRTMGRVRALEAGTPGFVKAYMHAGLIDYD